MDLWWRKRPLYQLNLNHCTCNLKALVLCPVSPQNFFWKLKKAQSGPFKKSSEIVDHVDLQFFETIQIFFQKKFVDRRIFFQGLIFFWADEVSLHHHQKSKLGSQQRQQQQLYYNNVTPSTTTTSTTTMSSSQQRHNSGGTEKTRWAHLIRFYGL